MKGSKKMAVRDYDMGHGVVGTKEQNPDWDEILLKQAESLLENARGVRLKVQETARKIVGYEPPTPENPSPIHKEPDCFSEKMAELLRNIDYEGREIKHEIERL
jgi:hypothetical protein